MSGAAKKLPRSNRAETRSKLVQIGTDILSEKGFDTTTIDDVLQRAAVPKGSFYYYFASKAEFGLAVVDNYAFLWEQNLTRLLRDPNVRPLQRIRNYISEAARGLETYEFRRGCLIGNMGQELGGTRRGLPQTNSRRAEQLDRLSRRMLAGRTGRRRNPRGPERAADCQLLLVFLGGRDHESEARTIDAAAGPVHRGHLQIDPEVLTDERACGQAGRRDARFGARSWPLAMRR